jgi:predicted enzyme related to lactoylglutathione lyase
MAAELLINIDVSDLERAIMFYTDALGLRLGRHLFEGSVAEMLDASATSDLLAKPAGTPVSAGVARHRSYERHWTPVHLDFVVSDIHAAVGKAKAAGARLEGEVQTYAGGRIAHMADPFGHGFVCSNSSGAAMMRLPASWRLRARSTIRQRWRQHSGRSRTLEKQRQ